MNKKHLGIVALFILCFSFALAREVCTGSNNTTGNKYQQDCLCGCFWKEARTFLFLGEGDVEVGGILVGESPFFPSR